MKIALFTAGVLPVPATKGGAVENLVQMLIEENEKNHYAQFTITSIYDESAATASVEYTHSDIYFVKPPLFVKRLDSILYKLMKLILPAKAISFRMIFSRLWFIKKSKDFFLQCNFDFIIAENHPSLFLVMKDRKMQKQYGNKFFYHAHNEPNGSFGCRKQINQCPRILTVSKFISNSWQKEYKEGIAKYIFVPNGIDINMFSQKLSSMDKLALCRRLGIAPNDFVILFAGRLVEGKGILHLAKVFSRIQVKEKKLLIVGSPFFGSEEKSPFQEQLEQTLDSCRDKVVFTGYIPYSEMWKYYKISSVACFVPIWNEAAPLTNIEAQASSLSVVTTISGGIPEYLNPQSQILLPIDENLEQNLLDKLMWLYENPKICQEIGRKNCEFAQQFSMKNFYINFLKSLENTHE